MVRPAPGNSTPAWPRGALPFALADRWWALMLRGAAAILFGIFTFMRPGSTVFALVIVFGLYAAVDGVMNLQLAVRRHRAEQRWGWLVAQGIMGLVAAAAAFFRPGMSAFALLMVIAAWAVVTGGTQIATAIRLRKVVKGEWILALSGALAVAFGVLVALRPGAGALAVAMYIGAWALVTGAMLVGLSLKLRAIGKKLERRAPTTGVPTSV